MGISELCKRLNADYRVSISKNGILQCSLYMDKERIWTHKETISFDELSSLFKEAYSEVLENLIPGANTLLKKS